jgi:hypothetical protein
MEKIESGKIVEIIKEYKSRPNNDLKLAMDFIQKDFEISKETLIKLTNHLITSSLRYSIGSSCIM